MTYAAQLLFIEYLLWKAGVPEQNIPGMAKTYLKSKNKQ
jgi:hypothetical protein